INPAVIDRRYSSESGFSPDAMSILLRSRRGQSLDGFRCEHELNFSLPVFDDEGLGDIDLLWEFDDSVDTLPGRDFAINKVFDTRGRPVGGRSILLDREGIGQIKILRRCALYIKDCLLIGSSSHRVFHWRLKEHFYRSVVYE